AILPPYPPAVGPGSALHSDFNFIYRALLNDFTAPPQLPPLPAPSNSFIHSDLNFIYQAILAMNSREMGDFSYRGVYDASTDLFPTTGGSGTSGDVIAGDVWNISVLGVLGGIHVYVGYTIRALVNSPGQTASDWNIMNVGYGYVPVNRAGDTMTGGLNIVTSSANALQVSGSSLFTSAISRSAWGLTGAGFRIAPATLTDTTSSGTVASVAAYSFDAPTFATSSSTAYTNAANLYLAAPIAGTNVTFAANQR